MARDYNTMNTYLFSWVTMGCAKMKSLWLLMPEVSNNLLGRPPCCYRVNELFIWHLDDGTKKVYLGCYLRLVVNCCSHSILEDFASLARIVHYFNVANINISPKTQYCKILSCT